MHAKTIIGELISNRCVTIAVYLICAISRAATAGTFVPTGNLNGARFVHTATLLTNGRVLVAGGLSFNGPGVPNMAELYNPDTGAWTLTGELNTPRYEHTATLLANGKVLVTGGDPGSHGGITPSPAELYDPATGTWTNTGVPKIARYSHAAVLLPNGKVLVAGGYTDFVGMDPTAELYDPATETWTLTGSLNTPRKEFTLTLLPNGKVLAAGGWKDFTFLTATAELYDPASGIWTGTETMASLRASHSTLLLPNGKALVAGGVGAGATNELYVPAAGTWAPATPMNFARAEHIGALLPNGQVLVAGGTGSWAASQTAELYNPTNGTWTVTGSLNTSLYLATGTLLPNGAVLVAGGSDTNGNALANAELYLTPAPIMLTQTAVSGGWFQFNFTNLSGLKFAVWGAPDAGAGPSSWTALGTATEFAPGQFQFTDPQPATMNRYFYKVSCP